MKLISFFTNKEKVEKTPSFTSSTYFEDYSALVSKNEIDILEKSCVHIDIPLGMYEKASSNELIKILHKPLYQSPISFEIAKNIANSNTIDSVRYNQRKKTVSCSHVGGILFAVLYDFYIRNEFSNEDALMTAVRSQFDCIHPSLFSKAKNLIGSSLSTTNESSRFYSAALAKTFHSSQVLSLNLGFYQAQIAQEASWEKLSKELAVIMASSVGEHSGRKIGSAVGSTVLSVIPVIGKKVGDTVGGALGSYGGSKFAELFTSSMLDTIDSSEKLRIAFQSHFEQVCFNFALSRNELPIMHGYLSEAILSIVEKQNKFSTEEKLAALEKEISCKATLLAKNRARIELPPENEYMDVLHQLEKKAH